LTPARLAISQPPNHRLPRRSHDAVARNDGVNWEKLLGNSSNDPAADDGHAADTAGCSQQNTTAAPVASHASDAADGGTSSVPLSASRLLLNPGRSLDPAGTGFSFLHHQSRQTSPSIAARCTAMPASMSPSKRANPSLDPNRLRPGTNIVLPISLM